MQISKLGMTVVSTVDDNVTWIKTADGYHNLFALELVALLHAPGQRVHPLCPRRLHLPVVRGLRGRELATHQHIVDQQKAALQKVPRALLGAGAALLAEGGTSVIATGDSICQQ